MSHRAGSIVFLVNICPVCFFLLSFDKYFTQGFVPEFECSINGTPIIMVTLRGEMTLVLQIQATIIVAPYLFQYKASHLWVEIYCICQCDCKLFPLVVVVEIHVTGRQDPNQLREVVGFGLTGKQFFVCKYCAVHLRCKIFADICIHFREAKVIKMNLLDYIIIQHKHDHFW